MGINLKLGDALLIEWEDSHGCPQGWEFLDELEPAPPPRCFTIGFVLKAHRDYITLVHTDGAGQIMGRMTIPTSAILRKQRLPLPSFAVGRLREVRSSDAANRL